MYKAFDEEEGLEVAWNQVRVSELVSSKEERDRLFAEIRVLKQLKHKNIMTFHDSWLDQKTFCVNFITELFTSGTLRQCAPGLLIAPGVHHGAGAQQRRVQPVDSHIVPWAGFSTNPVL